MIPKIIHYCWFSGEEYPPLIQKCIDSWHKYLPDYEFRKWDATSFDFDSLPIVKAAIEAKKWAFAADYIRVYAIYHYGGIYIDSDVELFSSLDHLLDCNAFFGTDTIPKPDTDYCYPEAGIFGGNAGISYMAKILDYYEKVPGSLSKEVLDNLAFEDVSKNNIYDSTGKERLCIAPIVLGHFMQEHGYCPKNTKQILDEGTVIYPTPYIINHCFKPTKETIAWHHNTGSWCDFAPRGPLYKLCHKISFLVPFYEWLERTRIKLNI